MAILFLSPCHYMLLLSVECYQIELFAVSDRERAQLAMRIICFLPALMEWRPPPRCPRSSSPGQAPLTAPTRLQWRSSTQRHTLPKAATRNHAWLPEKRPPMGPKDPRPQPRLEGRRRQRPPGLSAPPMPSPQPQPMPKRTAVIRLDRRRKVSICSPSEPSLDNRLLLLLRICPSRPRPEKRPATGRTRQRKAGRSTRRSSHCPPTRAMVATARAGCTDAAARGAPRPVGLPVSAPPLLLPRPPPKLPEQRQATSLTLQRDVLWTSRARCWASVLLPLSPLYLSES